MNLAKALKLKNRLAQKINELQKEVQEENSGRKDAERKISVEDSMEKLNETTGKLIQLKIAIFVATTPMRETILRLGELKSRILFLKGIDVKEGKIWDYGEKETEYSAVYDKIYIKEQVAICENSIDDLQEQLDKFNHNTNIAIEVIG